jgi:hypothetical protein
MAAGGVLTIVTTPVAGRVAPVTPTKEQEVTAESPGTQIE